MKAITLGKVEIFLFSEETQSSYKALQPILGSDLLNHVLPIISILCYFLPIAYVYALYIFQKSSSRRVLGLPIGLLDMSFHL